ncbi:ras gtpase-activating protein-binding-like protein [Dermatophagoides farinae]|uniref:Ras gtpase-activating protein-binding-like protein n=1 Tax=Dermatophagoides farinae TaxID=6954 RepID=A0A9D4NSL6_DERFA|nr:ras gtpase-activating protein-binding-like protein [Dermatophagoides farinae]
MMNRAPQHLFRFYSEDSTFIHGTLDKPDKNRGEFYHHGQKQINNKIMSLNFLNCHTKVRQVDSMRTLGNGIVIQIVGDLSNNRQPSRRFNQTIVLAPDSPNKYYVRNDIFRYQDDVADGMCGDHQANIQMLENGDSSSLISEINVVGREMNQSSEISKSEPGVIDSSQEENFQSAKQQQLSHNSNANNNNIELIDIGKMMTPGDQAKAASVQPTDKAVMGSQPRSPITPPQPESNEAIHQQMKMVTNSDKAAAAIGTENLKHNDEDLVKSESKPEQQEQNENNNNLDEIPKTSVFSSTTNEPKTYAGILGRGSTHQPSMTAAAVVVPASIGQTSVSKNPTDAPTNVGNVSTNFPLPSPSTGENSIATGIVAGANVSNMGNVSSGGSVVPKPPFAVTASSAQHQQSTAPLNQQRERDHRFSKKSFNRRNDSRESGKNNDSDSADGVDHFGGSSMLNSSINIANSSNVKKYPDENQLFLGNLLPDISEEIVHTIFGKFGKIVDVRINRQKITNLGKNRNYGFITFEDPQVVDKIIAQKPIYHENHRYNVEKKQGKNAANTGSSNYDRNRERNSSSNVRNPNIQTNPLQSGSGSGPRGGHMSGNPGSVGGAQMNQIGGGPRNRSNFNHQNANTGGGNQINRGGAGGQGQFSNRQMFNHPPPSQQQQSQQNR